jgi:hypothetical protein
MRDASGSVDRIYVRDANGDAVSTWDLPAGVGDIVGTPRWDSVGGVNYLFVATAAGRVYKLINSGGNLSVAPSLGIRPIAAAVPSPRR